MIKKLYISLAFICLFAVNSYSVKVYPNPWIPSSNSGQHGSFAVEGHINFKGVPQDGGEIYIYNATGELIRTLKWESGNLVKWDGKNNIGEYVASGVYIWVMKDGGTKSGKIVIVR